jgi:hypothetical protein
MRYLIAALFWLTISNTGVLAQSFYRSDATTNQNVLVGFVTNDFPFLNFLKMASNQQVNGGGTSAWPSTFDTNNYPNNGVLSETVSMSITVPTDYCSYHWILDWTGTAGTSGNPTFQINGGSASSPRMTIYAGSSFVSGGSANFQMQAFGTNGKIEFSWKCETLEGNSDSVPVWWLSGSTNTNLNNMRLYRCVPDCTTATTQINQYPLSFGGFNPDFIAKMQALKPGWIRTLNMNTINIPGNLTSMTYSPPITEFSYFNDYWMPSQWVGTITNNGSDGYSNETTLGKILVPGMTVQGKFSATNTGTSPTFALDGGTALPILQTTAAVMFAGGIKATAETLIYDGYLNAWLYNSTGNADGTGPGENGIVAGVPLQIMIWMANAVNAGLWLNIPCFIQEQQGAPSSTIAQIVNANLNPQLPFATEWCNEVWNPGFQQLGYAIALGNAMGQTGALNIQYSAYALRSVQIMNDVIPYISPARYYGVLAYQINHGDTSQPEQYRFEGQSLCGTSCSNATYQSLIGTDYNVKPNRPIDKARIISGAPYFQGTQCTIAAYSGHPSANFAELSQAADQYAAGDSTDAFAFFTGDITGVGSSTGSHTLYDLSQPNQALAQEEKMAMDMSATTANPFGTKVIHYEGAMQCIAPTVAECNRMTGSSGPKAGSGPSYYCGPSGAIQTALNAYKNSSQFQSLMTCAYTGLGSCSSIPGFISATYPHTLGTAQYELTPEGSGDPWALYPSTIYATPFKSYNALKAIN